MSAYALTVEAGTPLADDPARQPDDDVQADDYELADDAADGRRAGQLRGVELGPARATSAATTSSTGASTTTSASGAPPTPTGPGGDGGTCARRSATSPRSRDGRSTEAAGETLDGDVRRVEGLQLALRTTAGVRCDALDGDALPGLVERAGDRWVLTRRGRLMANEVAVRLR